MRYWLLWSLASLTFEAGDLEGCRVYTLLARALCEAWPDSREAARISAILATLEAACGNAEASLACGERAVGLARQAQGR